MAETPAGIPNVLFQFPELQGLVVVKHVTCDE